MKKNIYFSSITRIAWSVSVLGLLIGLSSFLSISHDRLTDFSRFFAGPKIGLPPKLNSNLPKSRPPLASNRNIKPAWAVGGDPIRFSIVANKRQIRLGEEVELTITAELLNISPQLMFFLPGSNAFRLKLLKPPGFVVTGGDFEDWISGELSYPNRTTVSYHLRGFFEFTQTDKGFRLLRGNAQANQTSLFVEKATLLLNRSDDSGASIQARQANNTLVVTTTAQSSVVDCNSANLLASANPGSTNPGGSVVLSATCSGCSGGGTTGGAVYTTNFDGETLNGTFSSTYADQVKLLNDAQNGNGAYCSVTDHSGNGGKVLSFSGDFAGTIWQKSINVTAGVAYTFSMWVRPLFNGNTSVSQRSVDLRIGSSTVASANFNATNVGCLVGWVQLQRSWTATTTGAVDFAVVVPGGTSWQNGFAIDDLAVSSGSGGGSAASYTWSALQGGSNFSSPNNASTNVVVPSTAGTYTYRVTETGSGCSQDVSVTVNAVTPPVSSGNNIPRAYVSLLPDNPIYAGNETVRQQILNYGIIGYTRDGYNPPYYQEWKSALTANGTQNQNELLGARLFTDWSFWKPGTGQGGAYEWQPGNISPDAVTMYKNSCTYLKSQNMKMGLGFVALRDWDRYNGFMQPNDYAAKPDQGVPGGMYTKRVPHFEFAEGALSNPADYSNPLAKWYSDLVSILTALKPHYEDGTITFAALGTRSNFETGYESAQDDPNFITDYSELSRQTLRAWLKGRPWNTGASDAEKLGILNQRWGTPYTSWDQVDFPFNPSDGLSSYSPNNLRNRDTERYRIVKLADRLCLDAKAYWTVMPNLALGPDIGQWLGGQAPANATLDVLYLLRRLRDLKASMGATGKIIFKLNSGPSQPKWLHARTMSYIVAQVFGSDITIMTEVDFLTANPNYIYPDGTRSNGLVEKSYNASDIGRECAEFEQFTQGYASVSFNQLYSVWQFARDAGANYLSRDRTRKLSFDATDPGKSLNTSPRTMLAEGNSYEYSLKQALLVKSGLPNTYSGPTTQDVKIIFDSLWDFEN